MNGPTRAYMNRHFGTSALNFGAVTEAIRESIIRHMIRRMKTTSSDNRIEVIHVSKSKDRSRNRRHITYAPRVGCREERIS